MAQDRYGNSGMNSSRSSTDNSASLRMDPIAVDPRLVRTGFPHRLGFKCPPTNPDPANQLIDMEQTNADDAGDYDYVME